MSDGLRKGGHARGNLSVVSRILLGEWVFLQLSTSTTEVPNDVRRTFREPVASFGSAPPRVPSSRAHPQRCPDLPISSSALCQRSTLVHTPTASAYLLRLSVRTLHSLTPHSSKLRSNSFGNLQRLARPTDAKTLFLISLPEL